MEITVLDVTVPSGESPPTKPVLAIHAGSVRRQAKLEVNQPFVIPHPGSQCGPVEVSVFQQLASYVIDKEEKTESFCNIPVSKADGQSSQVQLRVRRGEAANSGKKQKADDDMAWQGIILINTSCSNASRASFRMFCGSNPTIPTST
jgi:hypothetical protein